MTQRAAPTPLQIARAWCETENLAANFGAIFWRVFLWVWPRAGERVLQWLKEHAPHITPQTNTFPDSNPEMLYQTRQFVFSPEEYSVTGTTGNGLAMTQHGS